MPLVLLLVLGLVFLGLVIFGVFFLIQVVSALLFGKVSTRVTVNRQEIFPNAKPGLAFDETSVGDETGNGQVIDILPEPKKERQ